MNKRLLLISITLAILISSCGIYKNRGRIDTNKDLKSEKKKIEFQYSFFEGNKNKMLGNLKEAGAYYLRCIELDPKSAAAHYEFANILVLVKDFDSALKYSERAYELSPNNKWYQALLVSLHKSLGHLKKSSELLENMLTKHPDDYNSYIELTDTYLQMNKVNQALEILEKFEKKYGYSEALMIEKNRIHISKGDYASARLEVQKMIKLDPENVSNYILLADLYSEDRQLEKAYEIYLDILKMDPDNGQVHFSLSEYYRQKGDDKKSYEELKKAFASDKVDLDLKIKLLFSYVGIENPTNEEKKQVYELINTLLERHPDEMKVHSLYSDILVKDKQYEEARNELLLITKNTPDNYLVWEQLLYVDNQLADFESLYKNSVAMLEYFPNKSIGYFFAGLGGFYSGKYKEAAEYLETGVDFAIGDTTLLAQMYTVLGDSHHRAKNDKASDEAFEQAITLNPNNYYVQNNYSYYLSLRGEKLDRAKSLMAKCIEANPKNGTYLDTYAWVLYKSKDLKKALSTIKSAYENGGKTSAVIVEHYGDILFANGKEEEALKKWKEASKIGKGSELLGEKIKQKKLVE